MEESNVSPKGNRDRGSERRKSVSNNRSSSTDESILIKESNKDGSVSRSDRFSLRREAFIQKQMNSYDNVKTFNQEAGANLKLGSCGERIPLLSNFVRVQRKSEWKLYHYHVTFDSPEELMTREKKNILRKFHSSFSKSKEDSEQMMIGAFIFDGAALWTTKRINPDIGVIINLIGKKQNGSDVGIQIKLVAEVEPGDTMYLHFYSIVIRKCLDLLKLDQLGRNYFDQNAGIRIENHGLELWPGYITSMRNYDGGLLYSIEITHKVIRLDTVFDFMMETRRDLERHRGETFEAVKAEISKQLVGTIVITTYNNKTYRIDDISWTENPQSKFFKGKNSKDKENDPSNEISYFDYFQSRYNITIGNKKQPLLISYPKKADIRRGMSKDSPFKLIPELCKMTGLSESMRSNFVLMRDMTNFLFQPPNDKVRGIEGFIQRIKGTPQCRTEMNSWGLNFTSEMMPLEGRLIPKESIIFRENGRQSTFSVNDKGDFTMAFRSNEMVKLVNFSRWAIIVQQREAQGVDNVIRTMTNVARPLGIDISQPIDIVRLSSANVNSYIKAIEDIVNKYKGTLQIIFIVLPNNSMENYSAVKKQCYLRYGVLSQCFLSKNLRAKGLMSIATKVVVQMNAKLGGEPWNIKIPLSSMMIIGYDVHRSNSVTKRKSLGAMVASIGDSYGRYYSTTTLHETIEDMAGNMSNDVFRCLKAWRATNGGSLPSRIVFYRGGVGEGQLDYVYNIELQAINDQLQRVYKDQNLDIPKFTFIICTKKINARFFRESRGRNGPGYENPPPGTVIDNTVTIPERWDFYLISHCGRQGTVSPTNYNIIFDRSGLDSDKIQRLTYKLCHLYYNWSGGISIPAVVQYASKLAYLTGIALANGEAHQNLRNLLYFL